MKKWQYVCICNLWLWNKDLEHLYNVIEYSGHKLRRAGQSSYNFIIENKTQERGMFRAVRNHEETRNPRWFTRSPIRPHFLATMVFCSPTCQPQVQTRIQTIPGFLIMVSKVAVLRNLNYLDQLQNTTLGSLGFCECFENRTIFITCFWQITFCFFDAKFGTETKILYIRNRQGPWSCRAVLYNDT